jgi:hypothetical protein
MKMFRHDYISDDHQPIAPAHLLRHGEKKITPRRRAQHRLAPVATASDEVQITRPVTTLEKLRHMASIDAQPFSKM